jgi:hypothetical protein
MLMVSNIQITDVRQPDYTKFPEFKGALDAKIEVEVRAGEALFIPNFTWYFVSTVGSGCLYSNSVNRLC